MTVLSKSSGGSKTPVFMDSIENMKKKEIERRKILRIIQVREQSKQIAQLVRERWKSEAEKHLQNFISEASVYRRQNAVKSKAILRDSYRQCLSSVGTSHRAAAKEPDAALVRAEALKVIRDQAEERGKVAVKKQKEEDAQVLKQKEEAQKKREFVQNVEKLRASAVLSLAKTGENNPRSILGPLILSSPEPVPDFVPPLAPGLLINDFPVEGDDGTKCMFKLSPCLVPDPVPDFVPPLAPEMLVDSPKGVAGSSTQQENNSLQKSPTSGSVLVEELPQPPASSEDTLPEQTEKRAHELLSPKRTVRPLGHRPGVPKRGHAVVTTREKSFPTVCNKERSQYTRQHLEVIEERDEEASSGDRRTASREEVTVVEEDDDDKENESGGGASGGEVVEVCCGRVGEGSRTEKKGEDGESGGRGGRGGRLYGGAAFVGGQCPRCHLEAAPTCTRYGAHGGRGVRLCPAFEVDGCWSGGQSCSASQGVGPCGGRDADGLGIRSAAFPVSVSGVGWSSARGSCPNSQQTTQRSSRPDTRSSQQSSRVQLYDHTHRYTGEYALPRPVVSREDVPTDARFDARAESAVTQQEQQRRPVSGQGRAVDQRSRNALRKLHLQKDYCKLMTDLRSLSKEERVARAYAGSPVETHMTDERVRGVVAKRQHALDKAFQERAFWSDGPGPDPTPCAPCAPCASPFTGSNRDCSPAQLNVGLWRSVADAREASSARSDTYPPSASTVTIEDVKPSGRASPERPFGGRNVHQTFSPRESRSPSPCANDLAKLEELLERVRAQRKLLLEKAGGLAPGKRPAEADLSLDSSFSSAASAGSVAQRETERASRDRRPRGEKPLPAKHPRADRRASPERASPSRKGERRQPQPQPQPQPAGQEPSATSSSSDRGDAVTVDVNLRSDEVSLPCSLDELSVSIKLVESASSTSSERHRRRHHHRRRPRSHRPSSDAAGERRAREDTGGDQGRVEAEDEVFVEPCTPETCPFLRLRRDEALRRRALKQRPEDVEPCTPVSCPRMQRLHTAPEGRRPEGGGTRRTPSPKRASPLRSGPTRVDDASPRPGSIPARRRGEPRGLGVAERRMAPSGKDPCFGCRPAVEPPHARERREQQRKWKDRMQRREGPAGPAGLGGAPLAEHSGSTSYLSPPDEDHPLFAKYISRLLSMSQVSVGDLDVSTSEVSSIRSDIVNTLDNECLCRLSPAPNPTHVGSSLCSCSPSVPPYTPCSSPRPDPVLRQVPFTQVEDTAEERGPSSPIGVSRPTCWPCNAGMNETAYRSHGCFTAGSFKRVDQRASPVRAPATPSPSQASTARAGSLTSPPPVRAPLRGGADRETAPEAPLQSSLPDRLPQDLSGFTDDDLQRHAARCLRRIGELEGCIAVIRRQKSFLYKVAEGLSPSPSPQPLPQGSPDHSPPPTCPAPCPATCPGPQHSPPSHLPPSPSPQPLPQGFPNHSPPPTCPAPCPPTCPGPQHSPPSHLPPSPSPQPLPQGFPNYSPPPAYPAPCPQTCPGPQRRPPSHPPPTLPAYTTLPDLPHELSVIPELDSSLSAETMTTSGKKHTSTPCYSLSPTSSCSPSRALKIEICPRGTQGEGGGDDFPPASPLSRRRFSYPPDAWSAAGSRGPGPGAPPLRGLAVSPRPAPSSSSRRYSFPPDPPRKPAFSPLPHGEPAPARTPEAFTYEFSPPLLAAACSPCSPCSPTTTTTGVDGDADDSTPDIVGELLRRRVMTSPFGWMQREAAGGGGASGSDDLTAAGVATSSSSPQTPPDPGSGRPRDAAVVEEMRRLGAEILQNEPGGAPDDLDGLFRRLGLGWAAAMLRKTQETLAISSSSSEASMRQPPRSAASRRARVSPAFVGQIVVDNTRVPAVQTASFTFESPNLNIRMPSVSLMCRQGRSTDDASNTTSD